PVARPFPDVAGHVEQAIAVGRETADGGGAAVSGLRSPREITVPVVGEPLTGPLRRVAPGVRRRDETAPSRHLPLRLAGHREPRPRRVRLRVLVRDVYDRVVGSFADRRMRTSGAPPRCTWR